MSQPNLNGSAKKNQNHMKVWNLQIVGILSFKVGAHIYLLIF